MNIESILASFNLDPVSELYDLENFDEVAGIEYLKEAYTEASTGTNSKNIFQKLIAFIIKCFQYMANLLKRAIAWFKKLFMKKGSKTADQICKELNIAPTGSTPAKNNGAGEKVVISIPSSPLSDMKVEDEITLLNKDLFMSFDADRKSVIVSVAYYNKENNKARNVKAQEISAWGNNAIVSIVSMITKPDLFKQLEDAVTHLMNDINTTKKPTQGSIDMFNTFIASISKSDAELFPHLDGMSVSLESLTDFQLRLNNMMKQMEALNVIDTSIELDFTQATTLNQLANVCASLQMGLNAFVGILNNVYKVDSKYIDSVKDINVLSAFVAKCIQAGLPPKYVGFNAFIIADPKFKGKKIDKNKAEAGFEPVWGQSRMVMFPKPETGAVYKIALSGWGIASNKSEINISNEFTKAGGERFIARVVANHGNAIIENEKVKTANKQGETIDISLKIPKFNQQLRDFMSKHNYNFMISDIHDKNVGIKNHGLCVLDYAWADKTGA